MPRRVRILKKAGTPQKPARKKLIDAEWREIGRKMDEMREWDRRGMEVGIPPSHGALPDREYDRREEIKRREEELRRKGKKGAGIIWEP